MQDLLGCVDCRFRRRQENEYDVSIKTTVPQRRHSDNELRRSHVSRTIQTTTDNTGANATNLVVSIHSFTANIGKQER